LASILLHSPLSCPESGTRLGVTQASRPITRRLGAAMGLCQDTRRASGSAHASPRGGEGGAARWGQGVRLPLFRNFAGRPAPPPQANFTGEAEPSPRVTSTFRSRCGQHVSSFFPLSSVSASGAPLRQARCKTCLVLRVQGREALAEPGPLHRPGAPTSRVVPLLKRSRRPPAQSAFGASATQQVIGETARP